MRLPYPVNRIIEAIIVGLVALNGLIAYYAWRYLPNDRIPTHFGLDGQPDGWSSKMFVVIFFPLLVAAIYALVTFLPLVDPRRERYQEFGRAYQIIRLVLVAYLTTIYLASIIYALGWPISIADVSTTGIGLLFVALGNYLPKIKPNWFVGIRTPWTLSNEDIWRRTHRVSGWLFVVSGLLLIGSLVVPSIYRFILLMVIVGATVIFSFVYPYWLWRKNQRPKV